MPNIMYDFIFYFIYVIYLKRFNHIAAKNIASVMVFFCSFLHLALLFIIFQFSYLKLTGRNLLQYSNTSNGTSHILFYFFLGIVLISMCIKYFNNESIEKIKEKYLYKDKSEFIVGSNVLTFFLVFLLPVILIIIFG